MSHSMENVTKTHQLIPRWQVAKAIVGVGSLAKLYKGNVFELLVTFWWIWDIIVMMIPVETM